MNLFAFIYLLIYLDDEDYYFFFQGTRLISFLSFLFLYLFLFSSKKNIAMLTVLTFLVRKRFDPHISECHV